LDDDLGKLENLLDGSFLILRMLAQQVFLCVYK